MANRNSSAYTIPYVFIILCGESIKNLHTQLTCGSMWAWILPSNTSFLVMQQASGHITALLYCMLPFFFLRFLSLTSLSQLPQWFPILSPCCTWILSHCWMCLRTLCFIYTHQSVGHLCFLAAAHSAAMIMGVQMALWYTDFIWRGVPIIYGFTH